MRKIPGFGADRLAPRTTENHPLIRQTSQNFDHRKVWIERQLELLTASFG